MKNTEPTPPHRFPKLTLVAAVSSIVSAMGILILNHSDAINDTTTYILMSISIGLMILSMVVAWSSKLQKCLAAHRYLMRIAALMSFYMVTLLATEFWVEDSGLSGWPAFVITALPGLSFAGIFWVFCMLILEEQDEFIRLLYVRQGLIGTGIALTLAAVWGFLENYGLVQHVAAFWWPVLWCFGIGIGALMNQLKYGIKHGGTT
ncbi:MAG: hypothetical protein AAF571_00375 [Verrucomicrobiota bacterium]